MEHIIRFTAGYDCIAFECKYNSPRCKPGLGGSHGKHGVNLLFVAKGEKGAVQFLLYTGWIPQRQCYHEDSAHKPLPADLGYHSKTPRYFEHTPQIDTCEYCDGQPCYYDGSTTNADFAMQTLVNGGDEALWKFLDKYYACVFEGGKFPKAAKYPTALRSI